MPVTKLDKHEILDYLRPEQVNRLSEVSETIKVKKGEKIYPRGAKANYFYIVLKGKVTLRLGGIEGVSIILDTLGPGTTFGGCVSHDIRSYTTTAMAVEDSELLKIKSATLKGNSGTTVHRTSAAVAIYRRVLSRGSSSLCRPAPTTSSFANEASCSAEARR